VKHLILFHFLAGIRSWGCWVKKQLFDTIFWSKRRHCKHNLKHLRWTRFPLKYTFL